MCGEHSLVSAQIMMPEYFEEDINKNPLELLEHVYSKSEIKQLVKQGSISVARKDTGDLWEDGTRYSQLAKNKSWITDKDYLRKRKIFILHVV